MKTLKILDWPAQRFCSESHPFHKWKDLLYENGLKVEFYSNHKSYRIRDGDYLMIHSRYFQNGWQNTLKRTTQNEAELITFLDDIKKHSGKLIWFDAADSTGSNDFGIIGHVDTFLKKQLLKNIYYYTNVHQNNGPRIWLNPYIAKNVDQSFVPCPQDQLHKLKLGWNIGLNDYRYFGYRMSWLSNYVNYNLYPNSFTKPDAQKPIDLTFRGRLPDEKNIENPVCFQRSFIFQLLDRLNLNIACGGSIPKYKYWKELRQTKISLSPFGWGEICYRDFESFLSGSILIKPSMEHLRTYPDLFLADETYLPVNWDLDNLEEKLYQVARNYNYYKQIAVNGQECYKKAINNGEAFVHSVWLMLS